MRRASVLLLLLTGCGGAGLADLEPARGVSARYYAARLASASDLLTFLLLSTSGPPAACPDFSRASIPLLPPVTGNYNLILRRPLTAGRKLELRPEQDGFFAVDSTDVVCGPGSGGTPTGYARPTGALVVDAAGSTLLGHLEITQAGTTESLAFQAAPCPAPALLSHSSMCPE